MFNRLALEGLRSLGYAEDFVNEAAPGSGRPGRPDFPRSRNKDAVVNQLVDLQRPGRTRAPRVAPPALRHGIHSEIQEKVAYISNPANMSVLTADKLAVINGSAHIESIPWLDKDTGLRLRRHQRQRHPRAISPAGHVLMLGALQPLHFRGVLKTVNMPVSAAVRESTIPLIMSHDLGVKCIAFPRRLQGERRLRGGHAGNPHVQGQPRLGQLVNAGSDAIDEIIAEASKPRQRRAARRLGQTVKFSVGSQLTGYPDGGRVCGRHLEVFGRLGQVGSFASGMFEGVLRAALHGPPDRACRSRKW